VIKGKIINLVPATLGDRQNVYEWCFHSETTKSHAGPPDFPEINIPTFEEFSEDYADYYFTGSELNKGRGFIITQNKIPVGFISYASFHLKPGKAELDIWINSEANCGKGYGTDAIVSLTNYLYLKMNITDFIMRPAAKNPRANKSYLKAGFIESDALPNEYLLEEYLSVYGDGDYGEGETVLLRKKMK